MSTTAVYGVDGMTCGHCVASVTEEIGLVAGAENVTVELVKGGTSQVTVTSTSELDRTLVAAAVEEAGYQLVAAA
jgi:copper chaperone CopZ